jgi:ribonuclease E
MSDYWDAVSRAALGLPGSAKPRPRSIYETDEQLAAQAGFEAVEQEVDAVPVGATPAPAADATPLSQPAAAQPARAPRETPAPDPQPAQIVSATHERLETRIEVPVSSIDSSASLDDRAERVSPPPAQAVARLDVHRIETTRTIVEQVEACEPGGVEVAASEPLAQETAAPRETRAGPAAAAAIEPPSVIVAEPIAPAPERQQPGHEPPPPPLVIEIGRIDIRIASEAAALPAPAPVRRDSGAVPSLSEYLVRRSEAKQ